MGDLSPISGISTIDEVIPVQTIVASTRGELSPVRLEEHLRVTAMRLRKMGIGRGDSVASVLPEGSDAATAKLALAGFPDASFVPLALRSSSEYYESALLGMDAKLLLMHPGKHPAREAARSAGIPVADVLRHFEAGLFTLESALMRTDSAATSPWKQERCAVPLVLIAPVLTYRRLASRLDSQHHVIGITPPSGEHLPPPHTIEHIAAECVRMLRRYHPHGPYGLAGWRDQALVALEMARLLEEDGEKVAFVAMLDASRLFWPPMSPFRRLLRFMRRKYTPSCEFMAVALRQYRPRPWYGKILHIRQSIHSGEGDPRFEWRSIAPHGFTSYEAPAEMQSVATILAAELEAGLLS